MFVFQTAALIICVTIFTFAYCEALSIGE